MNLYPILITDDDTLAACARQWREADALAVDTEFIRTDTFYPKLGLIQVCDGDASWLLDPLAIDDMAPFVSILGDKAITKVFHSCSEDLEVLQSAYDVLPAPLFDTQVAASFVGYGFSLGYGNLVEKVLDIRLEKHETRSDWLQRPLTEAQCHYAAEDVHYLMQVYRRLRAELEDSGRLAWLEADMEALLQQAATPAEPQDYYLRIKNAWKLDGDALRRLRRLASWREGEARRRNKPRNRIVPDRVLPEIARIRPSDYKTLAAIEDLHPRAIQRYGDRLLTLMDGEDEADQAVPATLPEPLDREARKLLSSCRDLLNRVANDHGMAPETLARKRELEALVRSRYQGETALPPLLASGWRHRLIGEELLNHVREATL